MFDLFLCDWFTIRVSFNLHLPLLVELYLRHKRNVMETIPGFYKHVVKLLSFGAAFDFIESVVSHVLLLYYLILALKSCSLAQYL